MVVWPWKIRETLIESNEWLTDVIRTKNSEQRFSQRKVPRQSFIFTHTFTEDEYQGARSLIRQNDTLLVPDWTLAVNAGQLLVNSGPQVTYGEPGVYIGDQVLIWDSQTKYEAATVIDTDSSDSLYLDNIEDDYENAKIIPLRQAQAPDGLQVSRKAGPLVDCSIEFNFTDSRDLGKSDYALYLNDDVITDCPVIADESFDESIRWPFDNLDDGINYPAYLNQRNKYDGNHVMRWHVFNRSDLYSLRRFIHSRRGKWKQFWLPTFKNDFTLSQQIGASDAFIVVYAPSGITDLGITTFDVEIDGQYYRKVTSYTDSVAADGRPVLQLNMAAIGVALPIDTRISFLRHLRIDADRIEFNHKARGGTHVTVPCIEV